MEIGTIVLKKYKILSQLGIGGMSRVFLCEDIYLKKLWAIKVIKKSSIYIDSIKEAYLLKDLDHPSLPRVVDVIEMDDSICIVMDYIDGKPLSDFSKNDLSKSTIIKISIAICDVLYYLHTMNPPIIHGDIKPSNILVTKEGRVKLIDFGISYKLNSTNNIKPLGSKGYASPNQINGNISIKNDIFSLGVTIFVLLTHKSPGEIDYKQIRDKRIRKTIRKCIHHSYKDTKALKNDLLKISENKAYKWAAILFMSFFILSILYTVFLNFKNHREYDNYKYMSKTSNDSNEQVEFLSKAIDIYPYNIEDYFELLNILKLDGEYSENEDIFVNQLLNHNIKFIESLDKYESLLKEIGELYWYYYDDGIRFSIPWFEKALEYDDDTKHKKEIKLYISIATFIRDKNINLKEGRETGIYRAYFNDLCDLNNLDMTYEDDIFSLTVANLIITSINENAEDFMIDGVKKSEIETLFNKALKTGNDSVVNSKRSKALKEYINNSSEFTKNLIDEIYDRR